MQSLLPHLPMMEASPSPPPPAPEPIPQRNAEALPLPPCFLELVKQQAERRLPSKACTPMLLQRANMLLQDAVDAASMCMRAHVDSPGAILSGQVVNRLDKASIAVRCGAASGNMKPPGMK